MWLIKRLTKSTLVRGSLLIFVTNNFINFGNFLYNLLMGRMLGVEKYGDLGAIVSLGALLGLPLGILNLYAVKTVSAYWGKRDKGSIISFLSYFTPRLFIIGVVICVLLITSSSFFVRFLGFDSYLPFLLVAVSFILSGPSILNKAALQGSLSFSSLTISGLLETVLKLILSLTLVYLNFQLVGALLGPLIGGVIVYLFTLVQLRIILGEKRNKSTFDLKEQLALFMPVFFAFSALTIFFTLDIVLVRHFFPANLSGEYVALSTTGKIIYYAVGPVITVMFPLITSRINSGLPYVLPLLGTLALSLAVSFLIIFIYFFAPKLIIGILYGSHYYGVIPYLGLFSFFITIHTINSILTYFLLSVSYNKPMSKLFFTSMLQGILIYFFHKSIYEVIWVNIIASIIYLFVVTYYVWKKESIVFLKLLTVIITRSAYER